MRLESHVREFVGYEHTTKCLEALTRRNPFEGSVVHDADELGRDEYMEVDLETGESSYTTEHTIGPVRSLGRDLIVSNAA